MRKTGLHLLLALIFTMVFASCAHQPISNNYPHYVVECESVPYNSPDWHLCHEDHHHSEAASLFGYIIFRTVVEGIVHGIVYH